MGAVRHHPCAAISLSVGLLLLFASPGLAQDRPWIAGGAVGVAVEPDRRLYGRVLQGEELSGSPRAFVVWGGRVVSPRWRLIGEAGTAGEVAADVVNVRDSVYYIARLHRRHHDVIFMAVGQFNQAPGCGFP